MMHKAEKSWSGMRKYLEQEMLAPTLAGRVRYDCAAYPGMQHGIRFQVFVDDIRISQFSMETMAKELYDGGRPVNPKQFWFSFCNTKLDIPVSDRTVFDDEDFASALKFYRSIDISTALASENPIVRMFAILDRRVGKRTLAKLRDQISIQPKWLQFYYNLRLSAENLI